MLLTILLQTSLDSRITVSQATVTLIHAVRMPCIRLPGFSYVAVAEFLTSGHLSDILYLIIDVVKLRTRYFMKKDIPASSASLFVRTVRNA